MNSIKQGVLSQGMKLKLVITSEPFGLLRLFSTFCKLESIVIWNLEELFNTSFIQIYP